MANTNAYIPLHALRKLDIQSMLSIALPLPQSENITRKYDYHHSRRTMLYFLKSICEASNTTIKNDLIKECSLDKYYERINKDYMHLKTITEPYQQQYRIAESTDYWELTVMKRSGSLKSKEYISKYRQEGFKNNELKLYWNYDEIRNLVYEDNYNKDADLDAHDALLQSPVNRRANSGKIKFVQTGIENAVFQVPEGNQVIVLDFADERMPGGYFLENARTQEEVILYNSDGYRALLDLKYKIMAGGYMLPEFGVAYIKGVRFFEHLSLRERLTDLIVAACYDLSGMGEGLYKPPSRQREDELRQRTKEKFQAIIASAVANTHGDGRNTYLLLGPIGTGAFNNDMKMIAEIFSEILNDKLMDSENAICYAFEEIWFVSIDSLAIFRTHVKANI